jgi:UDP-N-acetylmuramoyl-tripeptide--D-alanyl-D-alanine ligase
MAQDADFAVIEIGMNHPGEIAPLSRLTRPHVILITIIAPAHLEAFDSLDDIAREKAAICEGLEPGGVAVLPDGQGTSQILIDIAHAHQARVVTFGSSPGADYRLLSATLHDTATIVRAEHAGQSFLFKVLSPGRHFAANGLAALAVAASLGLDPVISATDLGRWSPPQGRGLKERIVLDAIDGQGFDLFDDAFNANPTSMAAALDVLIAAEPQDGPGRIANGRRIAILGDMLELGPTEDALHRAIAAHPGLAKITTIHCVGPRMQALHALLPRAQRGDWVAEAKELLPRLRALVDAGDVVLVKGSKGIKVSLLVDGLKKLGQSGGSQVFGGE